MSEIMIFQLLFQFRVVVAESIPAVQGTRRDPPWTRRPPITRLPSPSQTGTMETRQFSSHAHLWDVGGTRVPGENSRVFSAHRQRPRLGTDTRFLISVVNNKTLNRRCYSRTYYSLEKTSALGFSSRSRSRVACYDLGHGCMD